MTFKEKAMQMKIDQRYDLSTSLMCQVMDEIMGDWMKIVGNQAFDLVYVAFNIGYQRGERAARAKPMKEPKTRNEIRQALTYQVYHTKNNFVLRDLLQMADILRRQWDDKEYKTVSKAEHDKVAIIQNILHCDDAGDLRSLNSFVRAYMEPVKEGK